MSIGEKGNSLRRSGGEEAKARADPAAADWRTNRSTVDRDPSLECLRVKAGKKYLLFFSSRPARAQQ